MPDPAKNALEYVNQAALDPNDRTLPANRDGIAAIDYEIGKLQKRIDQLLRARDQIKERIPR